MKDVIDKLRKEKTISKRTEPGNIVLAGHSGAYRVMAYILQNGNLPVEQVILFDALYSETDKFLNWLNTDSSHRFINIFTDGGGTDKRSREMETQLISKNIFTDTTEEKDLKPSLLQQHKIIFIHSLHKHNDIINNPDNFQLFVEWFGFVQCEVKH